MLNNIILIISIKAFLLITIFLLNVYSYIKFLQIIGFWISSHNFSIDLKFISLVPNHNWVNSNLHLIIHTIHGLHSLLIILIKSIIFDNYRALFIYYLFQQLLILIVVFDKYIDHSFANHIRDVTMFVKKVICSLTFFFLL